MSEVKHSARNLTPAVNSRVFLMAGFGGLLVLTALAGADGLKALEQIESSNDRIREDFLLRTRVLERIRSDLYRSGTDVRDYLLEPAPGKAEGHRYTLLETRRDMDAALQQYIHLLSSSEARGGMNQKLNARYDATIPVTAAEVPSSAVTITTAK